MARSCFPLAGPGVAGSVDAAKCSETQQNYEDDIYIANQFGGYHTANWGTCQTSAANDQCLLDFNLPQNPLVYTTRTCNQGAVPPYYVDVREPNDVVQAISFVKKHKIPLVVKNSGHDYKGRSSGQGSLALWTHNLQGIKRNKRFVPAGCPTNKTYDGVTLAAGTGFAQLYQFAEDNNITVLGGSSRTVGPSGGWIQGAGHGALSNMLGLGVDRALQFKIVTPDGKFLTASPCQNTDLFWAIRGGGGSTFGVIMESTTTAAPKMTVQVGYVRFASLDPESSRKFTKLMIELAPQWAADGWGGYIQPGAITSQTSGFVMFTTKLNRQEAEASMQPALDFARSLGQVPLNAEVGTETSFYQAFNKYLLPNDELVNVPAAVGSRLIPRRNFQPANQAQLLDALMNGANTAGSNVLGGNGGSGSLAYGGSPFQILVTNPVNVASYPDSAVTPAWRYSLWHVLYAPTWNYDGDPTTNHIKANKAAQFLRDITPGSGAYQNEASIFEPNHIQSFWGQNNYNRLLSIKKKVDPNNIFTCWQCVGYNKDDPRFACYPKSG
ncbi:hypothetical protein OIO90_003944 [Microbotryomycetes sp. JL221]|nr:hypothetical protein OIO90_003944 [Microbotryomycetes sp. JL221]